MNNDLVSRRWLLEEYDKRHEGPPGGARKLIEEAPPADVRPVIPAQWIALDIYRSEGNYKCSNCGQPCYVPECMGEPMYSVCPNCGADMREATT